MKRAYVWLCIIGLTLAGPLLTQTFTHACDGSAILAVGDGYFFNATDEDNLIRLYRISDPGEPVRAFAFDQFLKPEKKKKGGFKEADLEAVARIGSRAYWTGSFGRDKNGNEEPSRLRLFAVDVTSSGASTVLKPSGKPYRSLIEDLMAAATPEVSEALKASGAKAHQQGGIDVEGMAATSAGALLIGFRSPLVGGKALLASITNPRGVTSSGAKPKFGKIRLLDLKGLGVRDIIPTGKPDEFYILAGDPALEPKFAIYRWRAGSAPVLTSIAVPTSGGSPEGLMLDSAGAPYLAMDGGEQGSPKCKDRDEEERTFLLHKLAQ